MKPAFLTAQALAERVGEDDVRGARPGTGEHHVHEPIRDADHGKTAHEGRDWLEDVVAVAVVDHRRRVFVAVENADDIVFGQRRQKGGARLFRPPVRGTGAVRIEGLGDGSQCSVEKSSQP